MCYRRASLTTQATVGQTMSPLDRNRADDCPQTGDNHTSNYQVAQVSTINWNHRNIPLRIGES